jgi:hypothetical protein
MPRSAVFAQRVSVSLSPQEMPVISLRKAPLPHLVQVRPSSLQVSLSLGLAQPVQSIESRFGHAAFGVLSSCRGKH